MAKDFLETIITETKKKVEERRIFLENIRNNTKDASLTYYGHFKKQISKAGRVNLIAEIKKASPSRGIIRESFSVMNLARIYAQTGASAISVLTEEGSFCGRPDYVRIASDFGVPILAKDFFVDELQIHEAFSYGAKAILLIMAALDDAHVKRFMDVARGLDMDCLVEVHTDEELDRAVSCGAAIIGVNNRDLKTFNVDLNTGEKLVKRIPDGVVKVVESGIASFEDIQRFKACGANAVLIGETFMRADNVADKIREIMQAELTGNFRGE